VLEVRSRRTSLHLAFRKPESHLPWTALGGAGHLSAGAGMNMSASTTGRTAPTDTAEAGTSEPQAAIRSMLASPASGERVVVGIGEFAVMTQLDAEVVTHARQLCRCVPVGSRDEGVRHAALPAARVDAQCRAGGVSRERSPTRGSAAVSGGVQGRRRQEAVARDPVGRCGRRWGTDRSRRRAANCAHCQEDAVAERCARERRVTRRDRYENGCPVGRNRADTGDPGREVVEEL
jgi:hypothetical protein